MKTKFQTGFLACLFSACLNQTSEPDIQWSGTISNECAEMGTALSIWLDEDPIVDPKSSRYRIFPIPYRMKSIPFDTAFVDTISSCANGACMEEAASVKIQRADSSFMHGTFEIQELRNGNKVTTNTGRLVLKKVPTLYPDRLCI